MRSAREEGYVLVLALVLLTVMLGGGLALVAVVDAQGEDSGRQRERDAAFNLAESTLGAARFTVARQWPADPPGGEDAPPWSTATCADQTIDSSAASRASTPLAAHIADVVERGAARHASGGPRSWRVNVCDDVGRTRSYRDADVLDAGAPGWDANDVLAVQDEEAPAAPAAARTVWVRAEARVGGRRVVVASRVTVGEGAASTTTRAVTFPSEFSVVAGAMTFSPTVTPQVTALGTPPHATPWANALLQLPSTGVSQNNSNGTGAVALRCTAVPAACQPGAPAVTEVPLLANTEPGLPKVVTFGSQTVAGPEAVGALRTYAAANRGYVAQVADGASCIPGNPPNDPGRRWVVFVEKVGDGNGACVYNTSSSQLVALVVGSGRVRVTGSGQRFAVVYAANLQSVADGRVREVVTIEDQAQVQGAVWADGGGTVGTSTPNVNLPAIIDNQDLCNVLRLNQSQCTTKRTELKALPSIDQLVQLKLIFGEANVMVRIKEQLSSRKSPVIWERDRILRLNALTPAGIFAVGSGGSITGTFEQVGGG